MIPINLIGQQWVGHRLDGHPWSRVIACKKNQYVSLEILCCAKLE